MATWCQRDNSTMPFTPDEEKKLDFLYSEWTHPHFISINVRTSRCALMHTPTPFVFAQGGPTSLCSVVGTVQGVRRCAAVSGMCPACPSLVSSVMSI